MKKNIFYCILLAVAVGLGSCSLMKDIEKAANIVNCQFRVKSAENITLAGVNVQKAQNLQSLSIGDVAMLTTAALGSNLPLSLKLNVEAKNPNTAAAGLVKFDWILLIDGIEMTKGVVNQKVNIPAKGVSVIPVQMNVNLKKVLSGKSADAMLNFGMNLAGTGNKPTRIKLKLKPTINVGTYPLEFPDYISVGTEFSGVK